MEEAEREQLRQAVFKATNDAILADDAWQAELDLSGIDRYTTAARQQPVLRSLYDAKLAADKRMRQAIETLRGREVPR